MQSPNKEWLTILQFCYMKVFFVKPVQSLKVGHFSSPKRPKIEDISYFTFFVVIMTTASILISLLVSKFYFSKVLTYMYFKKNKFLELEHHKHLRDNFMSNIKQPTEHITKMILADSFQDINMINIIIL